jgi:hypothetical protein
MKARLVILGAALLLGLASCGKLTDVAWLRVKEIDSVTTSKPISSLEATILDTSDNPGPSEVVNLVLANESNVLGSAGRQGAGITVHNIHLSFTGVGGIPSYDYPSTLFIPPSSQSGIGSNATTSGGEATINNFVVLPHDLKVWLHDNVPSGVRDAGLQLNATITVQGRTDEGVDATTTGGLLIALTNGGGSGGGGGGGGGGTTLAQVSIAPTAGKDQATQSPTPTKAEFTVTRSVDFTAPLTVTFSATGSALSPTVYATLVPATSVSVAVGVTTQTIEVTPVLASNAKVPSGGVELTVTLTATSSSNYTVVGSPATVTILP